MLREDSIERLRYRARRRLPKVIFDFIDGGADAEWTLRRNIEEFARLSLIPDNLVNVERRDLSISLLGRTASMPLVVGPTGLAALARPRADQLLARAAQDADIPFVVSTSSSASIEEIADAAPMARLWMQVYLYKDRELVKSLIRRAADRGFEALVITADTPVLGHRSRDHANRFSVPIRLPPSQILELLRCPLWTLGILRHGVPRMHNLSGYEGADRLESLAQLIARNINPAACWSDLAWIRDVWHGKLILKGVLSVASAERAALHGFDAIVVSNHGGRQLSCAPASITVLPEIVKVVRDRLEIYLDSGIRSGTDIAKAIALGARSAMIGRATLYGVAAGGAEGARHAIELLRGEYDRTLALLGCSDSEAVSTVRVIYN